MGGVGIATRNRRYINYLNPAAVTARDSLAFMADMSVSQSNKFFSQGDLNSGSNTFNINSITIGENCLIIVLFNFSNKTFNETIRFVKTLNIIIDGLT